MFLLWFEALVACGAAHGAAYVRCYHCGGLLQVAGIAVILLLLLLLSLLLSLLVLLLLSKLVEFRMKLLCTSTCFKKLSLTTTGNADSQLSPDRHENFTTQP